MLARVLAVALAVACGIPGSAEAHGPVAPVALDYLARVNALPNGLQAKVVDGDQRMWLLVPAREIVVVLDYRGAPYLRFVRSGVEVNHNSAMYYLNQTPFPLRAPANLGPHTPPSWSLVSTGHDYEWHDGRLHALAAVALSPGVSFVGRWRLPLLVNGHLTAIQGGLWHADPPSIVWFWPILVLVLCVVAACRVRWPMLNQWTARILALCALGAITVAGVGRELHGRPTVSVFQLVELALILLFVVWFLFRIVRRRAGWFAYFVIGIVALWEGLELIPTLLNGFVLIAVPAFAARTATVLCLGCAAGLFVMVFALSDRETEDSPADDPAVDEFLKDDDWELV